MDCLGGLKWHKMHLKHNLFLLFESVEKDPGWTPPLKCGIYQTFFDSFTNDNADYIILTILILMTKMITIIKYP